MTATPAENYCLSGFLNAAVAAAFAFSVAGSASLLAGDLISRLVRVVQSINGLCKADKRQECRQKQKSFHRVSSSEDIL